MEDVVPLTAEEALPSIPKEQYPGLMIEGVLGDLVPEVKTAEARGDEEEEGSSSTTGKDDDEEHASSMRTRLMMH